METIIEIIFLSILYLLSLTLCVGLIADIIPRYLFKIEYSVGAKLGRGLKKITYPGGRAVAYEPHPAVRKYVNKYLLFTMDGYKYVQLKIGAGVNRYTADLICFDSRNKVIDVLDITENLAGELSRPTRLHHKTSHVALVLTSVNGKLLPKTGYMTLKLSGAPLYLGAVALTVFLQFVHAVSTVNSISFMLGGSRVFEIGYAFFILPSVVIGFAVLAVTVLSRMQKGVKVVRK